MKVIAKHQIAYNNTLYVYGDVFDIEESQLEKFKDDVTLYGEKAEFKELKEESTKELKTDTKTKIKK